MSITVSLLHRTTYRYERPVSLSPHVVRLRPAPHTRTPILSYRQVIRPDDAWVNWQQDPFGNFLARLVFPELTDLLEVEIGIRARMDAINPFEFFLTDEAKELPFAYEEDLLEDLARYRAAPEDPEALRPFLADGPKHEGNTLDYIVALNQYVQQAVGYVIRMEPGVQSPAHTLKTALGSCRDSAWLLVNLMRMRGYAARFVSGYLIQLRPDKIAGVPLTGPSEDFTDLHAWAEVYLPGAGWVGLDATSGLFAGEGHIPLAATPEPRSAAAITGAYSAADEVEVAFDFHMEVRREHEPPRPTAPIGDRDWAAIDRAGTALDARPSAREMRLTQGGEPTFVSALDRDAEEWTTGAVGPTKFAIADRLMRRLAKVFAGDAGLITHGQGKWYPGEQLPRWALALYWRGDGHPLWTRPELIAHAGDAPVTGDAAEAFGKALTRQLGIDLDFLKPAYEDPLEFLKAEDRLPANVTPTDSKLDDPQERERLARVFSRGLSKPAAWVLPLQQQQAGPVRWQSERWRTRNGHLFLMPGDSPAGFRLPLGTLDFLSEGERPVFMPQDPFERVGPLPRMPLELLRQPVRPGVDMPPAPPFVPVDAPIRTALTVELRDGAVRVFLPPIERADAYVELIAHIETAAATTGLPVQVEGYPPPADSRLNVIKLTPDPGVIEVNIHPAHSWQELSAITAAIYQAAEEENLDASSFMIDGRPTGSGGGNHIVVGGADPSDSPFLRRPDLLASVIRYWQRHPSLSYLFSGAFIGPTSQAPRLDEARNEMLYEMEIALDQIPAPGSPMPYWLVDRIFRHLLVDVTGNTHRAEICIDKLYSPDGPAGRLGLVEFRAFEMPPHPRMSLAQSLLIRALLTWFWEAPCTAPLTPHGRIHDKWMLPGPLWDDFRGVLRDLEDGLGIDFPARWFEAQRDFRCPIAGRTTVGDVTLTLRHGLEPWLVLGEEASALGTARYVDSSLERMEIHVGGDLPPGTVLACNGVVLPLKRVADGGQVAGVRFRVWQPASSLHPTIPSHGPLTFDIVDEAALMSRGGCTYHPVHPGGRGHETRPINMLEAEGRRLARFEPLGMTPGPMRLWDVRDADLDAWTVDLRRIRWDRPTHPR